MLGKGKSDPYAIINIGAQEFRTKTIDNTVNPKWDFWCEVCIFFFKKLIFDNLMHVLCYNFSCKSFEISSTASFMW